MRVAVLTGCGVLTLLLGAHALVPDVSGAGTLLDSAAPWLGLLVPVLLVLGLVGRTRAAVAVLVPAAVWCAVFGTALLPQASASGDLRVVSQNIFAANENPAATAADLAATGADVIGVQELTGTARSAVREALGAEYPHSEVLGTVGVWSRYPIEAAEPVDLGMGWTRALRARVRTPHGPVAVYVAHLPSLRPDSVAERNRGLTELRAALVAERADRVVVLADLNTATTDRAMGPLLRTVAEAEPAGFGFTWPAAVPLVRLDHVLYRGLTSTGADVVETRGSDHRAVLADLAFNQA
ncbi:endonuclease/exonuclease/phosphatase family protein [Saccharopolyspora hirsuta]|uniref:Endonuclease/exonuclease/phosphatase family protein n=1 Tax=Saccharopolyspora hirsuta TaxID=1837 RepID=A0A5M7BQ61_SACHI|nr:endonuclease/exonuclease/phosphatase family protein [Saccharopolyspora hirsuta]